MAQPIASISGLASGIQWRDMIDQLMTLERAPITRIESRISETKAQATAWKSFKAGVQALHDALKGLEDGSALGKMTTSVRGNPSGSPASVSVKAGEGAQVGTVRVRTVATARAQKLAGATFASRDAVPAVAGELRINRRAVAIAATDSLQEIAASINHSNTGSDASGVSASVLMTPGGEYRLLLTSARTGSAGMTLEDDGTGVLAGLGLDTPEVITTGRDAQLEVDGSLYTSEDNAFEGILEGITFTALSESTVELEVGIARDASSVSAAAKGFVDAMNAVTSFVKAQTGTAALAGNGTLRAMHNTLREPMLATIELADGTSGRLSELGIEVDRYGVYSLDASRLTDAFTADPARVQALLGGSDGFAGRIGEVADRMLSVGSGSVDGVIGELEGRLTTYDRRIFDLEGRLEEREAAMIRRFTAMEQAIAQAQTQSEWLTSQINAFEKK